MCVGGGGGSGTERQKWACLTGVSYDVHNAGPDKMPSLFA